jgi:alpha-1,2-mannosyltransferase
MTLDGPGAGADRSQPDATVALATRAGWIRPALWFIGACSFGLTIGYAIAGSWHGQQIDLDVYRMGGRAVFGSRLYLVHLPLDGLRFTYPSFSALLFAPLGLVSFTTAQVVWAVGNVLALLGLLFYAIKALRPDLANSTILQWSLVSSAPALWLQPVRLTFNFGQINLFLALSILVDLTCELSIGRRRIPRGVLIGVASAVKLTPLVFVPLLLFTKRVRAGWTALGAFVGCNLVVAVVAPRATWEYWTKYSSALGRIGNADYTSNQNLKAFLLRVHHGAVPGVVLLTLSALVLVGGLALAVMAYRVSSSFLAMLVCGVTGLLVSPVTWRHHLVWVVPVIAWLVLGADRPRFGWVWATLTAVLFWTAPIWRIPYGNNLELSESPLHLLLGNSYVLAMMGFLIGIAVLLTARAQRVGAERRPVPAPDLPAVAS